MKTTFNKIKTWLATLGLAVVSFFPKAFGQGKAQFMYGVSGTGIVVDVVDAPELSASELSTFINTIIKLAKRPLIAIAFIVGIISLIKIRKIEDKAQKKKKIKRTIIIISILVVLIVSSLLLPLLLKK